MEDCLAALRQEVDRLDDQITELFLKRMEVTGRIGACKEELGLPLMDPGGSWRCSGAQRRRRWMRAGN